MRPVFAITLFILSLALLALVLPVADIMKEKVKDIILPKLHDDTLKYLGNISVHIFESMALISFILLAVWLYTNIFNDRQYVGRY